MPASRYLIDLTPDHARRLAISRQGLAGQRPAADAAGILNLVRELGCVQLDPISVVDRTHRLVLFSRLGAYDPSQLDVLLWQERSLFEYWAHCASIVPTEDYPLHSPMMRAYPWSARTRAWVEANRKLKAYILRRLRRDGPLLSRDLAEDGLDPKQWVSTGWTSGRNVSRMLDFLWIGGKIMVSGRQGLQKQWDLAERVLPDWTPRQRLAEAEVTRRAAERAVRALGVARPQHIKQHFLRGRYPDLARALSGLEKDGRLVQAEIREGRATWPGPWFVHADDLPLLERLRAGDWAPRTTLLSPFDNLICDRKRTSQLFGFDYTIEIYVPAARRRYGYYVLPILHGDRLIGRLDPQMDRATGQLMVNAVFAEPGAPASAGRAVAGAVNELAGFLGARESLYNRKRLPAAWKRYLSG